MRAKDAVRKRPGKLSLASRELIAELMELAKLLNLTGKSAMLQLRMGAEDEEEMASAPPHGAVKPRGVKRR